MSKPTAKDNPEFVPLGTKKETEAFLLHVTYLRHEVFTTNRRFQNGRSETWALNVTEGYELAKARQDSLGTFNASGYGLIHSPEESTVLNLAHILTLYPNLDVHYAVNEADLSKPLLFAPVSELIRGEKVEMMLLIDGWHRLFRSVVETMETEEPRPLPAYYLTEDEARAVQITPDAEPLSIPTQPGTLTLRQLSKRNNRFFK